MTDPATIAVITKNRTNPAYAGALVGARAAARRLGVQIAHSAPRAADDVAEQAALIAEAIAARPAALVLLPAHASALAAPISEVEAAGIPLFMVVSRPLSGRWVSYLGSDDRALATTMARTLFGHLDGTGSVAVIDGHPDSITAPLRHDGFLAAAREHAGIRVLEAVPGFYQREPAHRAARELLARHARIDGVLVANDLMALGVLDALEEVGREASVVSANGTPEAVAAIKAGRLLGSASFDTLSFGALAVEAAVRHLRGERVPAEILLPSEMIDATNVARWDAPYESRASVAWQRALGEV